MSDGFVYFIHEEGTERIKIGFTEKHPIGRLKDFQTGNSNKLNLLGYIEGTYEDESNLHREFNEERGNGEWFETSPRLNNRIKKLLEESLEEKKSGIDDLNFEYNEGEKKDGIQDGKETETYLGGSIYVGELKNGFRHGQGILTYSDLNKYEGEWKDGLKHGQGTETYQRGKSVGIWKDNKFWNGTHYDKDGNIKWKMVNGNV